MLKNIVKRSTSLILVLVMIIGLLPNFALPVFAAANWVGDSYGFPGLEASWTISGEYGANYNKVTAKNSAITIAVYGYGGCGGSSQSTTATLTFTNTRPVEAKISFTVASNLSVNGSDSDSRYEPGAISGVGETVVTLASGGKHEIKLTSPKGNISGQEGTSHGATATITVTAFDSTATANVTFVQPSVEGCSYTVNGTSVGTGLSFENADVDNAYKVSATAGQGSQFLGWYAGGDPLVTSGTLISTKATDTRYFYEDTTVYASFAGETTPVFEVKSSGALYTDLNKAVSAATTSDTIIVIKDGVVPAGDYTIPSGVTLLVPRDANNKVYTTRPELVDTSSVANAKGRYRTLTLADGASITINGAVSIAGAQSMRQLYTGVPTGAYGVIQMDEGSTMTFNNGANLYAWGFVTGAGTVLMKNGSSVYEDFQVNDWRGGSASSSMMGKSEKVFPISQYYIQNVEVPITLEKGAMEYGVMSIDVSVIGAQSAAIPFIGADGMFELSDGSVTKDYDETTDRLLVDVNGSVALGGLKLSVSSYNFDSTDYVLPINSNITVNVAKGKTVTVTQDIAFLPGVEMYLEGASDGVAGATLKVNSGCKLYFYDRDDWSTYVYAGTKVAEYTPARFAPGKSAGVTRAFNTDASICVNGTVDASEAYIYTTANDANIYSTGDGVFVTKSDNSEAPITYQATQSGTTVTYVKIPVFPAMLKNRDSSYVSTKDTVSRTFTYDAEEGVWQTAGADGKPIVYNVTYNGNGATGGDMSAVEPDLHYGMQLAPNAFTKTGYTFAGWMDDRGTSYPAEAETPVLHTTGGDLTLYAQWTANTYAITYNGVEDAANSNPGTYTIESDDIELNAPSKVGYTFIGWTGSNGAVPQLEVTIPAGSTGDKTYTANWEINKYTVTFMVDGEVIAEQTVEHGTVITTPEIPTKEGYDKTAPYWYVGNVSLAETIEVTSDMIVYAEYKINTYTVTFVDPKLGGTTQITVNYGDTLVLPELTDEQKNVTGYNQTEPQWDYNGEVITADTTVALIYTPNKYTVTYVIDGETVDTQVVTYMKDATPPAIPSKTGYTTTGWDKSSESITSDVTITAIYTINSYTITFDTDGGSEVAPISGEYASSVKKPSNPTKVGHRFVKWVNANDEPAEIPAAMPAENLTFKAIWEKETYTLVFKNGESIIGVMPVEYGDTIELPELPTQNGYNAAWSENVSTVPDLGDDGAEKIISVVWTAKEYTITFVETGDNAYEPITLQFGASVPTVEDPQKAGYEFVDWDQTIPVTMPAENLTITAIWKPVEYSITYQYVGGKLPEGKENPATYTIEDEFTLVNPEQEGYTFLGWSVGAGTDVIKPTVTIQKGTTGLLEFGAHWQENAYIVVFDANNGSNDQISQGFYYDQSQDLRVNTFVYEGHRFVGWNTAADGSGTSYEDGHTVRNLTAVADDTVTLYAQWAVNSYTITFMSDGEVKKSFERNYGASIEENEVPVVSKAGYQMVGWKDEHGNELTFPMTVPAEDVVYTANWEANTYTVQFLSNGGSGEMAEQTFTYDVEAALPENTFERTGYSFAGWKDGDGNTYSEGANVSNLTSTPDGVVTLTAQWNLVTYEISYELDGGVADGNPTEYTVKDAKIALINPTKTGYTFAGWMGTDLTEPTLEVTIAAGSTGNREYTANWTPNADTKYTVNHWFQKLGSGEEHSEEHFDKQTSVYYGTTGTTVAAALWQDYTGFTAPAVVDVTILADGSATVDYYYTRNSYTITYQSAENHVFKTITLQYGADIPVAEQPTKEGYTFTDWDMEIPETMPAENLTATAKWKLERYTVKFVDNIDGQVIAKITDDYNSTIETPADPQKSGFIFKNWVNWDKTVTLMPDCGEDGAVIEIFTDWTSYLDLLTEISEEEIRKAVTEADSTVAMNDARFYYTQLNDQQKADYATDEAYKDHCEALFDTVKTYESAQLMEAVKDAVDPTNDVLTGIAEIVLKEDEHGKPFIETVIINDDFLAADMLEVEFLTKLFEYEEVKQIRVSGLEEGVWPIGSNPYTLNRGYDSEGRPVSTTESDQFNIMFLVAWACLQKDMPYENFVNYLLDRQEALTIGDLDGAPITVELIAETADGFTYTVPYAFRFYNQSHDVYWLWGETDATPFKIDPYAENSEVLLPEEPAKEGYTFVGWLDAKGNKVTGKKGDVVATMERSDLVYTAIWEINQYTITFDVAGGTAIEPIKQDYGTAVTKPADPTKEGYTFDGWDKEIPTNMPAEDMTITATWTVNNYKLIWNVDGVKTEVTYAFGEAVEAIAAPSKTGYTFAGWDVEIPATMPAEDMTITAKWTVNQYTITFANTGDVAYESITQDYGTEISAVADPAKTGYTFDGWDTTIPTTMPAENMTITAQWTINQYTITFDTDGGTEIAPITQEYGMTVTAPAAPTKTGHTFDGWSVEIPTTMPAENMTITAKWTANKYTITFDTDGGTAIDSIAVTYDQPYGTLPTPVRTGYTFGGWHLAGAPVTAETTVKTAGEHTLTAKWTPNTYTVVFNANGGTGTMNSQNFTYDELQNLSENKFSKTGYTFSGWAVAENGAVVYENGEGVQNLTVVNGDTVTLYAIWTANTYTVKFHANGGTGEMLDQVLTYDADQVLADNRFAREGYTFAGWNTKPDGTGISYSDKAGVKNLASEQGAEHELYATWNANGDTAYTVNIYTMNTDGGYGEPVVQSFTGATDSEATYTPEPKNGFTIDENASVLKGNITGDGTLALTVYYVREKYTITFDVKGGSEIAEIKGYFEAPVVAPEAPSKTGYTFAGWDGAIPETMPAGDVTITAKWTINQYTITFDTAGGSEIAPITQDYGTNIAPVADPVKTGYTFDGWDVSIPGAMPAGDLTITAQWTINQYTITFKNGDDTHATITKEYGTVIADTEKPADPDKTGHTFAGWDKAIPATMPVGDMTITALWTVNSYALTWNYEGGALNADMSKTVQVNFGAQPVAPGTPVREGYTFDGWDGLPATMPAEAVTVTAKWVANKYDVTIDAGGGIIVSTGSYSEDVKVTYDGNYTLPAVTRTGYTFTGWTDKNGGKVTEESTLTTTEQTLTANWDPNKYKVTFNADGGTVQETERVVTYDSTFGTAENKLPVPARSGYKFLGWYIQPKTTRLMRSAETGKTYIVDGTIVQILNDEVLMADWEIVEYAITYELNGGEVATANPETYTVETVGFTLTNPTKTGYTFAGWTGTGLVEPTMTVTVPKGNTEARSYTATWTVNSYTISYDLNGGVVEGNPENYTVESADIVLTNPTKIGYTFAGWTGTGLDQATEIVTVAKGSVGNRTYTATWTPNTYVVKFDANGGEGTMVEQVFTYDMEKLLNSNTFSREGYDFAGWVYGEQSFEDGQRVENLATSGEVVLVAKWRSKTYTISYDLNGGIVEGNPENYTVESADIVLTNPTKIGYTFAGWTGTGLDQATEIVTVAKGSVGNRTYTATWTPNTYVVKFDANGGEGTMADQTFNYDVETALNNNLFSRAGYAFNGWTFGEQSFEDGQRVENLATSGEVVLVAQWMIKTYTISYDLNGGEVTPANPTSYTIETGDFMLTNPTKFGYSFAGWTGSNGETAQQNVAIERGSTEDRHYRATWTPVDYEIVYDLSGGTVEGNPVTYTIETADITLKNPTRTGYTFAGWIGSNGETPQTSVVIKQSSTGERHYQAVWTPVIYAIHYDLKKGTVEVANPETYTVESDDIVLVNPVRTGYTFMGWTGTGLSGATKEVTIPKGSIGARDYAATWELTTYHIIYNEAGGHEIADGIYTMNDRVVLPVPSRTGYTFAGWYTDDGNKIEIIPYNSTGDVTVTAKWNINSYTIRYNLNGGSATGNPGQYTVESAITLNNPVKRGYTFMGWTGTGLNGTVESVTIEPGSLGNREYTAVWQPAVYIIEFDEAGGSAVENLTYTVETTVATLPESAQDGYTFAGWYNGETRVESIDAGNTGDLALKAKWNPIPYTIRLKLYDNRVSEMQYTIVSDDFTLENPSRVGYIFRGWIGTGLNEPVMALKVEQGSMGDREYIATWVPEAYEILFDEAGGLDVADQSYTIETAVKELPEATRAGYTFVGWYNGETKVESIAVGNTGNLTLKAKWNPVTYTVRMKIYGELVTERQYTIESSSFTLSAPVRTGYDFVGWIGTDLSEATMAVTIETGTWGDREYTATWKPVNYMVTLDEAGGDEMVDIIYTIEDAVTIPDCTREGYEFLGWYDGREKVENIPVGQVGDRALEAHWQIETYTIVFEDTGESVIADITAVYGAPVTMPGTPVKPGYHFDGWSENLTSMPDCGENGAEKVITATWTSYLDLLMTVPEAKIQQAVAAEEADTAAMMEARGYYAQLNDAQKTAYAEDEAYQSHHDVLFKTVETFEIAKLMKAVEEAEEPTNHVLSKDGNQYETDIAKLQVDGTNAVGVIVADDFLAMNMLYVPFLEELFAYEAIKQIYVPALPTGSAVGSIGQNPYTLNRGVGVSGTTSTDQFNIMFLLAWQGLAPGKEFKQFFDELQSETTTLTLGRMDGIEIEAELWAETDDGFPFKQSFTISFYNQNHKAYWLWGEDSLEEVKAGVADATTFEVVSYAENSSVLLHETPVKEGYTFLGWYDANGNEVTADVNGVVATMKRSDLVYTAKWEINEYTITFADTGDEAYKAIKQNYGTDIPAVKDPVKTGYTFKGWDVAIPATMPAQNLTITAKWEAIPYTITFAETGDVAYAPITGIYGDKIDAVADPVKTGYTFDGWSVKIPETMPAKNMTITANWKINQYTITFDTDGGTAIDPITKEYDDPVIAPADPTKTGYTFAGWDKTIPTNMPAEDMTITAKWTVNQHTITFANTGDVAYESITQDYGTEISAVADPAKTGYTFDGWDTTIPTTMPAENMTITAKWTVNEYTITFVDTGDKEIAPITQAYNTTVTAPADPTKTGYTFKGWDVAVPGTMPAGDLTITATWEVNNYKLIWNVDGIKTEETYAFGAAVEQMQNPEKTGYTFDGWDATVPAAMPAKNVELKATWTAKVYEVTINAGEGVFDGGSAELKVKVTYDQAYNLPEPTREGWTFGGWKLGGETVGKNTIVKITEDTSMTAIWLAGKYYKLSYDLDGGSLNGATVKEQYNVETETFTLPVPVKEGHTFLGWTGTDLTEATQSVTIQKGSTGDRSYLATWKANSYKLTWVVDGVETEETYVFGTMVKAPADPTKEGYTFKGWDVAVPATMPAKNLTITAEWTINQYTITFDTDGGSVIAPMTQNYSTAISVTAPTKEGYTFLRWEPAVPATMPAENVTVKAIWGTNAYTITFDTKGGSTVEPMTQDYGTSVTAPADPTREGYTFKGWKPAIPATMPAGNLTVEAIWEINAYTITFVSDGKTINTITRNYGVEIPAVANPTKEGHTFAGWDAEIPDKMPAGDLTITAKWTINQYTITFNTDGGTVIDPITQDYGTAVTAPADPTREGYTFEGWEPAVPATMPAKDMTVTANWKINQYTLTFDSDGGTKINSKTQNYGTVIEKPADPTKVGYTFLGWEPAVPETMPGQNLTVKAQWQINQYTISFDEDGGSEVADITQNYNTAVTKPADPTKKGHTFLGWMDENGEPAQIPGNMPAENVELKASWKVNQYTITFRDTGDKSIPAITADYGKTVAQPAAPTKTGYTFKGWDKTIPNTMPAEDLTITASWEINQYTITYDTDGGSAIPAVKADYGTEIVEPANPTRIGYTFAGWDKEIPATMPAENLTITAKWTVNRYTITFDSNGGSAVAEMTVDYGAKITAPAVPERPGYTFNGWNPALPGTMPAENLHLVAQWGVNGDTPYTVKHWQMDLNGEYQLVKTETLKGAADTEATATLLNDAGFVISANSVQKGMIKGDGTLVLEIYYERTKHTVKWNVNGVITEESVFYGAEPVFKGNTAKADDDAASYTFLGWDKEIAAVTGEVTYTAQYQAVYEAATINADGTVAYTWRTLKLALEKAVSGQTVRLERDLTLTEDLVVKNGVTLLVPCVDADSGYQTYDLYDVEGSHIGYIAFNHNNTKLDGIQRGKSPKEYQYRLLTIPEGRTLTVRGNGRILVNSVSGRPSGGTYDMDITGGYGKIRVDGQLVVESSGTLENFGYMDGEGQVHAKNGGVVGDLFIVRNWRGGSQALSMYNLKVFPLSETQCHNIQCDVRLDYGSALNGMGKMFATHPNDAVGAVYFYTRFPLIGNSNSLIRMVPNSYLIRSYDAAEDREIYEFHGGGSFASSALELVGMDVSSDEYLYPLDGDMRFILCDGDYTFANHHKALPGVEMIVRSGATLTVNKDVSVVFYDIFDDTTIAAKFPGTGYDQEREPAVLILEDGSEFTNNGVFAGKIQTTSDNIRLGKDVSTKWDISTIRKPTETQIKQSEWAPWSTAPRVYLYREGVVKNGAVTSQEMAVFLELERPGYTWRFGEAARGEQEKSIIWMIADNTFAVEGTVASASASSVTVNTHVINTTGVGKDFTLMVAAYRSDGKMLDAAMKPYNLTSKDTNVTDSFVLKTRQQADYVKIFVLSSDGSLKPLQDELKLTVR